MDEIQIKLSKHWCDVNQLLDRIHHFATQFWSLSLIFCETAKKKCRNKLKPRPKSYARRHGARTQLFHKYWEIEHWRWCLLDTDTDATTTKCEHVRHFDSQVPISFAQWRKIDGKLLLAFRRPIYSYKWTKCGIATPLFPSMKTTRTINPSVFFLFIISIIASPISVIIQLENTTKIRFLNQI